MLHGLQDHVSSGSENDAKALNNLQSDIHRALTNSSQNLKKMKEELKKKASSDEVMNIAENLKGNLSKITSDLPALKLRVSQKVSTEELAQLRQDILSTVEDITALGNEDPTVLLGARTYCLSCHQSVKSFGSESKDESRKSSN